TKHIALRYFLARELQQRGQLRLAYVASEANTADIFTKALAPGDHQRFCTLLEGVGYNLLSVSQLMAKGIHLEADSTTQEFKLYNERGGLYIGNAVLKNNVFVLDFVPDQGTADSDAIGFSSDSIDNSSSNNISSSRDNNSSSNIGRSRSNNNSTSTNRQLFINTNSCSTPQKC
ncbi:unnamed protein product, partial [Closterium sp. NIES-53]